MVIEGTHTPISNAYYTCARACVFFVLVFRERVSREKESVWVLVWGLNFNPTNF